MKAFILYSLLLLWVPLAGLPQQPLVIGESHRITSQVLAEHRTVNVYLPEGYHRQDTNRYPVIYVIDGGIREDFLHITGIVQYSTQPWINRIPPAIVVGIETTERRRDCTFPVDNLNFLDKLGFDQKAFSKYGGSPDYIAFLEKELQPFIDSVYNTSASRTVIGESLAGLLVTEILIKHRHLFDKYIIITPSLWWGEGELLREAPSYLNSGKGNHVSVYIGACNKEEDPEMYRYAVTLYDLLALQDKRETDVHFDYMPDESHATVIHQAVYNAFKILWPADSAVTR